MLLCFWGKGRRCFTVWFFQLLRVRWIGAGFAWVRGLDVSSVSVCRAAPFTFHHLLYQTTFVSTLFPFLYTMKSNMIYTMKSNQPVPYRAVFFQQRGKKERERASERVSPLFSEFFFPFDFFSHLISLFVVRLQPNQSRTRSAPIHHKDITYCTIYTHPRTLLVR